MTSSMSSGGDAVPGPQLGQQGVEELPDPRVQAVSGENVAEDVVIQPSV